MNFTNHRPKKDDILNAKTGKTFVTPNGFEYVFNWRKEGRKYIFIINYRGYNMQVSESDFNKTDIEDLINAMRKEITD